MKIVETIRRMHELGAPFEAILEAVDAIERERDASRDAKDKAAARSKKYRANLKSGGVSPSRDASVTRHAETPSPQVSLSPITPIPSFPSTPSEANASVSETSSDARKLRRKRNDYPEDFERLWKAFPTDANMSKVEAFSAWRKLSADDRKLCEESIPGFVAYCKKHTDYRPIHLNRYILKRRFEGHAEAGKVISQRTAIWFGKSPSWEAWRTHYRDIGQNGMVRLMDRARDNGGAMTVQSEWPPNHKPAVTS
jgi:hypothetical protein